MPEAQGLQLYCKRDFSTCFFYVTLRIFSNQSFAEHLQVSPSDLAALFTLNKVGCKSKLLLPVKLKSMSTRFTLIT